MRGGTGCRGPTPVSASTARSVESCAAATMTRRCLRYTQPGSGRSTPGGSDATSTAVYTERV